MTDSNYGDLKRTALVRLSHERFGASIDPIHTSNQIIRDSLDSGEWTGARVGQSYPMPKVIVPEAQALELADKSESSVSTARVVNSDGSAGREVYIVDQFDAASQIPPMDTYKSYHARKLNGQTDVETLMTAFQNGQNVLLQSDAGTGKNHLIEAVCAKLGVPQVAVSLSGGATVEDLIGQYVLVQGSTHWVDGLMTTFFRPTGLGGTFTADEINACPPEITFVCHQATDHRKTLVLAQRGREVVKGHKRFVFVGTMNPDYIGTRPLNPAMRDRFNLKLTLDYDTAIESKVLKSMGAKPETIKSLLALASKLRDQYRAPSHEITIPFSTRMLKDYIVNMGLHGEHIARMSMINSFDSLEQVAVREAVSLYLDAPNGSMDESYEMEDLENA